MNDPHGAGSADEIPKVRGWPVMRYLAVVVIATIAAIGAMAWARPSIFTSIVVVSGLGHHWAEPLPDSFYAVRVAPILEENCTGCHGPRLQRARLRLDSLGDVKLGGKSGAAVKPGDPDGSELYERLLLPKGDKRAMPAGNKPPLSSDEIRVIELWIAAGASGRTPVDAIEGAPPPPAPPIEIAPIDPEAVAKARAPLAELVQALTQRYPNTIAYLSRDSARVTIDAQRLGGSFTDADLDRLKPLAAAVIRLDLSGTAISDSAAGSLAAFEHLQVLRLNQTATSDVLLAAIASMPDLKTVTLLGTRASPERVAELRKEGVRVHDGRE